MLADRVIKDPIFETIPVQHKLRGSIADLVVQNESMFIALTNPDTKKLLIQHIRIQTAKSTDAFISLADDDAIGKLFVDPSGCHCLVTTKKGENFYINTKVFKAVPLKRLRNHVITAVAWNQYHGSDQETSFILVGTTTGTILETIISSSGSVMYAKVIAENIGSNAGYPITELTLNMVRVGNQDKWISVVCHPGQLRIFSVLMNTTEVMQQQTGNFVGTFVEPANAILSSLYADKGSVRARYVNQGPRSCSAFSFSSFDHDNLPSRFCWINEEGISFGSVDLTADADPYDLIKETNILKHERCDGLFNYPQFMVATEYHAVVIYRNKITAYSLYNYRIYFEESFSKDKSKVPTGICRDAVSTMIWMYKPNSIWKYKANKEKRYVWKVFLDQGDFARAREVTATMDDRIPFRIVVKKQGDHAMEAKRYLDAAHFYLESQENFDAIVLKFMNEQDSEKRKGLKEYLTLRAKSETNPVRLNVLVIWILEISMCEISEVRRQRSTLGDSESELDSKLKLKEKELRLNLLKFVKDDAVLKVLAINQTAVYHLILSHNLDFETHAMFSKLLRDYKNLVHVFIMQKHFGKALAVMEERRDPELFYKFANDLLPEVPKEFIAALRKNREIIQPMKLLHAFYKCLSEPHLMEFVFNYFKEITTPLSDPAIHAFLIRVYAEYKPDQLLAHLKQFGDNRDEVPYDPGNALRLCIRRRLDDCCVFLYELDGMHESAVNLALQISLDMAKEVASRVGSEPTLIMTDAESTALCEVRKHVWLTIARHMIANNATIDAVMQLIKDSENLINVEDLLPLFPQFSTIEQLQEPLCACLKEKSKQIDDLQEKVKKVSEVVEALKRDRETKSKAFRLVKRSDECHRCHKPLFQKPFYAFNCWHYVHMDCLEEYLDFMYTEDERTRYHALKKLFEQQLQQQVQDDAAKAKTKLATIRKKMTEMLTNDCPLCGERAVDMVDRPFFTEEEYEIEMQKWRVN